MYCFSIELIFSEDGYVINSNLIYAYFVIRFAVDFLEGFIYFSAFMAFFRFAYKYHYAQFKEHRLYLSLYFTAIFAFQIVDILMLF